MQTSSPFARADSRAPQGVSGAARVFTFGPFEVNLRTGEIRKHGIRLSLQEQPLRILAALVERPGEVVSREDLCRRLWPSGTFVDFEHSLNAAVRRLRVTLGDEAETPRFIETVHRRGYRFLAWGVTSGLRGAEGPGAARRVRLAVLPFVSFGQEGSGLWAVGLMEETITQLAQTCPRPIGVIARTSVMRLVASEQSAAEVGRLLAADYLLEGSVRREGDRVRIVTQLIESQQETHLWAATFDRVAGGEGTATGDRPVSGQPMTTDALTVQAEVAQEIARGVAEALNEKISARGVQ
jgi:TolB-like protein/DNA-binding winged helix-turn-helix (wHTH) protein